MDANRTKRRYTDATGQTVNPTRPDCPQTISAVKAIAIAASQGQKIYTITPKNAAVALPQLSVSRSVAAEIKNALAAGKEVTVHEKAINAYGFSGVGYIIVDPETGAGAYLIEGGGSGGWIIGFAIGASVGALIYAMLKGESGLQAELLADIKEILAIILLSLVILFSIFSIFDTIQNKNQIALKCLLSGFIMGFINIGLPLSSLPLCQAGADVCAAISVIMIGVIATSVSFLPPGLTPLTPQECHVN